VETAQTVQAWLASAGADRIVTGLGGHGVLGIYEGEAPGPSVMLRAELDALPIPETSVLSYRSVVPGKAHLCGHDGHMTILAGVALALHGKRPKRGRVLLLFQPAEEDGSGARAVLADEKFREFRPDFAFAVHNLPGVALGQVAIAEGLVNCASRGLQIRLIGRTAHASTPELGLSPAGALIRLLAEIGPLGRAGDLDAEFAMVTITHARLGEPAFGIAPGYAELWLTLRTLSDAKMDNLRQRIDALVRSVAEDERLRTDITEHDVFSHCNNAPEAAAHLTRALDAEQVTYSAAGLPMRASEDFGVFGQTSTSAMMFLGAGVDHAGLHDSNYDFPDGLIEIGTRVFTRTLRNLLG
jgi:amidohydrolase